MKTYAFEIKGGSRIDIKARSIKSAVNLAKQATNQLTGYYFVYDNDGYYNLSNGWKLFNS